MVGTIAYQLAKNRRITGFGMRRRRVSTRRGCGIVRRTIGNISRPALVWAAHKIADVITGTGRRHHTIHRRRVVRGSSYKYSGLGLVRRPRRHLVHRRRATTTVGGYKRRHPRA